MDKRLRFGALCCIVSGILLISGCDRPFADPAAPDIEILEPDFNSIFLGEAITISITADAFRNIADASVNGQAMTKDEDTGNWEIEWLLERGLNELTIEATDVAGGLTDTTVFALFMTYNVTPRLNMMATPTGGHTATQLLDGSVLVIGGTTTFSGDAVRRAEILTGPTSNFRALSSPPASARTGHTANLLPDGRVVIAGGANKNVIDSVSDLVESTEFYDPDSQSFEPALFSGPPIRRAFHTASIRVLGQRVLLDLYGGQGDIQYQPQSLLGIRSDIRTFEIKGDSIISLGPAPGPNLPFAVAGHTQTSLTNDTFSPTAYLVAGSYYVSGERQDVTYTVDFTPPTGIVTSQTGTFVTPRTLHSASRLNTDLTLVWGGQQESSETTLNAAELYIHASGKFLNVPFSGSTAPVKRYSSTATLLAQGRLLVIGGFTAAGTAVGHGEFFDYQL